MRHNEKFRDLVRDKTRALLGSEDDLNHVAEQHAERIIANRVEKSFFLDVYELQYPQESLAMRRFLNVGPGSFKHPYWRTADKVYSNEGSSWTEMRRGTSQSPPDYSWDIYSGMPHPEESGFFNAVYSSHVVEHLFDEDVRFFLREIRRLLVPGGTVRLVCPDAGLLARAYKQKDWSFFLHYLIVKTGRQSERLKQSNESELERMSAKLVLEMVSLVTRPDNPTSLNVSESVEFLKRQPSIFDAFTAASKLSSRNLNESLGAHVNWFHFEKLSAFLRDAGFTGIRRCGYLQSSIPVMRDPRHFDRTDLEMSLYVEAQTPSE